MDPVGTLLISADESVIRVVEAAHEAVGRARLEVCGEVEEAQARARRQPFAAVLLDLADDDARAFRLLEAHAARRHAPPVLVLSTEYRDDQAVALLRAGAADYLEVPRHRGKLGYLLETLTRRARPAPAAEANGADPLAEALAPGLGPLLEQVRRIIPQETTLLFTGETGTGKTRLARVIHELSPRHDEPFLVVDCGALSASLIESEMFGHVKGSFTGADRDRPGKFAAAGRGTLLLDEVNSLPASLQGKLLRAVDERVFEPVGSNRPLPLQARVIAVSNVPLAQEVAAGRFRSDLYYRLNVVEFYLPPLREGRGTVAALAKRFLAEFAGRNRPDLTGMTADALAALEAYHWPGNVRELRNVMERAVALSPGPEVRLEDLPEATRSPQPVFGPRAVVGTNGAARPVAPTLSQSKAEAEVLRITEVLRKHHNNRLRAAAELGISRMALYKKLHKYGLIGTA